MWEGPSALLYPHLSHPLTTSFLVGLDANTRVVRMRDCTTHFQTLFGGARSPALRASFPQGVPGLVCHGVHDELHLLVAEQPWPAARGAALL